MGKVENWRWRRKRKAEKVGGGSLSFLYFLYSIFSRKEDIVVIFRLSACLSSRFRLPYLLAFLSMFFTPKPFRTCRFSRPLFHPHRFSFPFTLVFMFLYIFSFGVCVQTGVPSSPTVALCPILTCHVLRHGHLSRVWSQSVLSALPYNTSQSTPFQNTTQHLNTPHHRTLVYTLSVSIPCRTQRYLTTHTHTHIISKNRTEQESSQPSLSHHYR